MEEPSPAGVNAGREQHLKSDFPSEIFEETVIRPILFGSYPDLRAGMSTKRGSGNNDRLAMNLSYNIGDDPAKVTMNRRSFFSSLGITESELAIPRQIHSSIAHRVNAPGEYQDCDALVTNTSSVALSVIIADCVPVLLFDPVNKSIGIAHAGWRGTAGHVVQWAVQKMEEEFGSEAEYILAFIGPSAGSCCYEVRADVAVKFENKIVPSHSSKLFIDLKKENAAQLQQLGLRAENIEMSSHCTICEDQVFHSYRRDGTRAGRMMALMCLKP